jgi:RNA polymerase sigma-70 factor (ECF subfamily)
VTGLFARDPLADPEPLVRRVYRYVAYRLGDGPEAEDVTSDVFERALRYRESYDRSKGEPIGWLLGIARACVASALALPREAPLDERERGHDDDLEDSTLRRFAVAEAVSALSAREQELLALRYGADMTARQIAEVLGERVNTIEVALHRALDRLRPALAETRPSAKLRPEGRVDPQPGAGL